MVFEDVRGADYDLGSGGAVFGGGGISSAYSEVDPGYSKLSGWAVAPVLRIE
jgi:hypothetical protein